MVYPDLVTVKAWMKLDPADGRDDDGLLAGMAAAESHQRSQCDLPVYDEAGTELDLPSDLQQAFFLRVQRYLARRNSPDGIVGFADFGPIRVSSFDADIERLEGPYRKVVVA